MEKNIYYRPVIPLLLALMAGLIFGDKWPGQRWVFCFIAVISAGLVLFQIIRNTSPRLSPIFLFIALGYLSLQFWVAPHFPLHHVIHFTGGEPLTLSGTVVEATKTINRRNQLILDVNTLSRNGQSFLSEGRIRVTLMGNGEIPEQGDSITVTGRIRSIRNFSNPGGFDYERFMAFKRISVSAWSTTGNIKRVPSEGKTTVSKRLDDLRNRIGAVIDSSGDAPSTGILRALIIGDKSDIPQDIRENFNRAGLGHILAISGLHMGIVATLSFFIFRWMLSYSSHLLWNARVNKSAALLTVIPVLFYASISGMSPSTQRAVIMTAVFLAAFQVEREQNLFNTLSIAALIILMLFPPALFSVSFQLSFTAVASILLGLSVFPMDNYGEGERLVIKWRNRILSFLWVSLFAILGTMPLTAYYFNQTSLVGILANCFAVPVIGFLVVPLGIVAAFITPVSTAIASFAFHVCTVVLNWSIAVIGFISGFSFAAVNTITPSFIEIAGFYLLLCGVCLFVRYPKKAKWALVFAAVILLSDAGYWIQHRLLHNDFRVTVLDVGQGTACVLEFPDGYTMLIDGGGFSDNSAFDVGERIVAPFLWRNKIRTVDTLVLSHPNSDHLNGLIYIAENFHVKHLWSNHEPADTLGYKKLLSIVKKNRIHHPDFCSLPRTMTLNGVEIKILHPEANFDPNSILARVKGENNNSMVVKTTFGSTSILFTGDICETAEEEMLHRNAADLTSTVLVCPHHGSKSSSTPQFVHQVNPEYVVIPVGWQNRFHFPHPKVLERYQKQECKIFRTDLDGAVRMVSNGENLWIKSMD